jgi:hypothetical protein
VRWLFKKIFFFSELSLINTLSDPVCLFFFFLFLFLFFLTLFFSSSFSLFFLLGNFIDSKGDEKKWGWKKELSKKKRRRKKEE